MRIYVIEDDEMIRRALDRFLRPFKAEVCLFDNPVAALDTLDATPIDLVICDFGLPGKDGVETLSEIRERHPKARTLLLSGSIGDDASIRAAVEAHVVDRFVSKPWAHGAFQALLAEMTAA